MVLEVGVGGKHVRYVVEGDGQVGLETWTLTRQQVSHITWQLTTARQAQAPDSWVQCLLSQRDRYRPLSILAITVAARTAKEEE